MSLVLAAKPQTSALPLPERVCRTTITSGRTSRATATVSSRDRPSTTTTSSTLGRFSRTSGRLISSLRAGITTVTEGGVDHESWSAGWRGAGGMAVAPRRCPAGGAPACGLGYGSSVGDRVFRDRATTYQSTTVRQLGERV